MTYLYFISNKRQSVVKIGVANKPLSRLRTFQTANHEELTILRVIKVANRETAFQLESALHEKFKKYHIRGEWFKLTRTVVHFIQTYQATKVSVLEEFIEYLSTIALTLIIALVLILIFN